MRDVNVNLITEKVRELCITSNCDLPKDVEDKLKEGYEKEESSFGKYSMENVLDNVKIAREENVAICQDTGLAVIFMEIGQDVHLVGGDLAAAVDEGVRQGFKDGYLRNSAVDDPIFVRKNTGDNTPALLYTEIVPGDKVKITVVPKGGGAENMSQMKMLKPAEGVEGVKKFVVESVINAGGNPCPPVVVGVGVGGTIEKTAMLAKKSLMREAGKPNPNPLYAKLEAEILEEVNKSGVGPQGLGGRFTAFAVHIDYFPAHIASMPVVVNLNCHAARHKEAII
ncbi:MAG: fumarate hydratase [Clostridia bacterium]|nr:fumarate hydratase [Clostridia bacterium]